MFTNESIDAIICCRGGYGVNRVLPLLDYDVIKENPKNFVGYSDITGFLCAMSQQSNLITFHEPMLTTFWNSTNAMNLNYASEYNLKTLIQVLSGENICSFIHQKNARLIHLKRKQLALHFWVVIVV
ncbi:MAG: muramoyltetrapeptide carboxypeptidase LdcA involved in peptidoglycan recycling [Polaribacter sp.]|jgi:muramoyltetrapeptide carboxypeptidase LdcA involved in peptidoglycan recycling